MRAKADGDGPEPTVSRVQVGKRRWVASSFIAAVAFPLLLGAASWAQSSELPVPFISEGESTRSTRITAGLTEVTVVGEGAIESQLRVGGTGAPLAPMAAPVAHTSPEAWGLSIGGTVTYQISGSTVRLTADEVTNEDPFRTSGTLRLALWLSASGYRQFGYRTATYTLGQLAPNHHFASIDSGTLAFNGPPTGCYYGSLLLEEYDGNHFPYVDYRDFTDHRISINGGCNVTSCSYSISPASASVGSGGGYGSVAVTGSPTGCTGSWSSSTNNAWISVSSGGSGSGAGPFSLEYNVQPTTQSRSGSLTIAGTTFSVYQSGSGGGNGTCVPGPTTLCIDNAPGDRRFKVEVRYESVLKGGVAGPGYAVPLAAIGVDHGGLFWFFSQDNPEVLIKVLNACGLNGHFWLYSSAGTNLGMTTTVTDTVGGGPPFVFVNPDLQTALPVATINAFPCP